MPAAVDSSTLAWALVAVVGGQLLDSPQFFRLGIDFFELRGRLCIAVACLIDAIGHHQEAACGRHRLGVVGLLEATAGTL